MSSIVQKVDIQGPLGVVADALYFPLMWSLQGFVWEKPQRGHVHNTKSLTVEEAGRLNHSMMVEQLGDPEAGTPFFYRIPRIHIPVFPGGWKKYVVLVPGNVSPWYPGWYPTNGQYVGYSKIPVKGPVRMLLGNMSCKFFGLNASGCQIEISILGNGVIGDGGKYKMLPFR